MHWSSERLGSLHDSRLGEEYSLGDRLLGHTSLPECLLCISRVIEESELVGLGLQIYGIYMRPNPDGYLVDTHCKSHEISIGKLICREAIGENFGSDGVRAAGEQKRVGSPVHCDLE